ncbi:DNA translocase FtsK [bacterium]|nr:DNA translocase FtsK [bacterium]MBT4763613.1 DNA translocase FtsK [bacterium]MBT5400985.1 DNA translocase FtsK [bacterium]MBT5942305.1 DNA translocase FtsK [bacterium]MBT6067676.1 DNA translocase FtsK [bacterium]
MARKKRRKSKKKKKQLLEEEYESEGTLNGETKRGIFIVLILVIALLVILSLFNLSGELGLYLKNFLGIIFGWGFYFFPVILLLLAFTLLNPERYEVRPSNYFGLFLLLASLLGLLQIIKSDPTTYISGSGGGYLGYALAFPLIGLTGIWATLIILVAIFLISLLVTFNTSLNTILGNFNILNWFRGKVNQAEEYYEDDDEEEEEEIEEDDDEEEPTFKTKKMPFSKQKSNGKIKEIPEGLNVTFSHGKSHKVEVPLNLLDNRTSKPTSVDIKANSEKIKDTLDNFGIEVTMGEVNTGPTVTQFTLKPSEGIRLNQITGLQNDLALALAAHPIRIEAPIPGKSLVGIEIPNQSIALVKLREILTSNEFKKKKGALLFSLGKDVAGRPWIGDLDKMPHLLIAGATGSGKSVCINNIIVSLLYQYTPENLRLIMVDPKRVELSTFNGIPHLLTPVITEPDKTINALRWAINEMDERYKLFSAVGKRNIGAYNSSVITNKLPYIVIIIDELADLMAVAPRDVEAAIVRLAQMARATGIHLIVATQRPSVNVITGLIKANVTSRIAFAVASSVDSRTIIDTSGAEKLLGKGDMLFISAELSKPKRLQCAFISDAEIEGVVDFWSKQGEAEFKDNITEKQTKVSMPGSGGSSDEDELLEEAKDVIIKAGKASASLLQRRLRVGYARAARMLDLLEEQGIVGPSEGAKPREILIDDDYLAIPVETTESYVSPEPEYIESEDTEEVEDDDTENFEEEDEEEKIN